MSASQHRFRNLALGLAVMFALCTWQMTPHGLYGSELAETVGGGCCDSVTSDCHASLDCGTYSSAPDGTWGDTQQNLGNTCSTTPECELIQVDSVACVNPPCRS